jgi:hypothetical protein
MTKRIEAEDYKKGRQEEEAFKRGVAVALRRDLLSTTTKERHRERLRNSNRRTTMFRPAINILQRTRALQRSAMRALSTEGGLKYPIISQEDFGAFKEYSVIHTDRSLNLMSDPFQRVMRDLNELLKVTYNCDKVAIIPG